MAHGSGHARRSQLPPLRRPHAPFADSSLTAYFYEQSNHNFVLYGTSYGYELGAESEYVGASNELDRRKITQEVLDHFNDSLSAAPDIDYDEQGPKEVIYESYTFSYYLCTSPNPTGSFYCPVGMA